MSRTVKPKSLFKTEPCNKSIEFFSIVAKANIIKCQLYKEEFDLKKTMEQITSYKKNLILIIFLYCIGREIDEKIGSTFPKRKELNPLLKEKQEHVLSNIFLILNKASSPAIKEKFDVVLKKEIGINMDLLREIYETIYALLDFWRNLDRRLGKDILLLVEKSYTVFKEEKKKTKSQNILQNNSLLKTVKYKCGTHIKEFLSRCSNDAISSYQHISQYWIQPLALLQFKNRG